MTIRAGGASFALGSGLGSGGNIAFSTLASLISRPLLSLLGSSGGGEILFFSIGIGLGEDTRWVEFACPASLAREGASTRLTMKVWEAL
jgi:hypothetical protein